MFHGAPRETIAFKKGSVAEKVWEPLHQCFGAHTRKLFDHFVRPVRVGCLFVTGDRFPKGAIDNLP